MAAKPVALTIVSTKSAKAFAECAADNLHGVSQLRGEASHWWILVGNPDRIEKRWDFRDTPTGSIAEMRQSVLVDVEKHKVRACA